MTSLEAPAIVFYLLAAVAALDMPDKSVAETNIFFDQKLSEEECNYLADFTKKSVEVKVGETTRTSAGRGTLKYLRFICVPVPK